MSVTIFARCTDTPTTNFIHDGYSELPDDVVIFGQCDYTETFRLYELNGYEITLALIDFIMNITISEFDLDSDDLEDYLFDNIGNYIWFYYE